MQLRQNYIVINCCFALLLLLFALTAQAAQVAGTVVDLSGPLLAKKADGAAKVLALKSLVEEGDLLVTEKDTYARIKLLDNSEITLRPGTQFKIDRFNYEQDKPSNDNAIFSLLKGGLRAVTGAVGKRSRERTSLNTPAATIGIRGTTYVAEFIQPGELDRRPPGLYVQVLDGMINLTNSGGSQNFAAGQFGFAPSFTQPPVILPSNPGMQFSPPSAFSSSSGTPDGGLAAINITEISCEVR